MARRLFSRRSRRDLRLQCSNAALVSFYAILSMRAAFTLMRKVLPLAGALSLLALLAVPVLGAAQADQVEDGGAALFDHKCALCHGPGGTGTVMLGVRLGKDKSLLTQRTDLTADFVRAMVRTGLRSMPPFTRVEVTDRELTRIAAFLSHTEKAQ